MVTQLYIKMEAEQLTENDDKKTVGWQQVRTGAERVSYSVTIALIYNEACTGTHLFVCLSAVEAKYPSEAAPTEGSI